MLFCLFGATIILAAIMGFADFGEGACFWGLGGQIVHGMLSIGCFIFVGAASLRFGWKIGLLDLLLVFIVSHLALMLHGYFRKKSDL